MNYIAQIKGFWELQEKYSLTTTDIVLYFYLLEVCNSSHWVNPFKRNTAKILADLQLSRSSIERARKRLNQYGIISFKSVSGTANVTYTLTDLEKPFPGKYKQADAGTATGCDAGDDTGIATGTDQGAATGSDQLNKNSKQKLKQAGVVNRHQAFAFFVETKNNRLLKDRFNLDNNAMQQLFKTFYNSKIDLGDLNNKTIEEIARNFYYWLPKHLAAAEKEKSCAKKESYGQPARGVAAAMKFANVEMREG